MQTLKLSSGANMPVIGLGTWNADKGLVGEAVKHAILEAGYRHIDCAAIYGNEKEIGGVFGEIFSSGKVKREEVFITSKLWNSEHEPERVEKAIRKTLEDLQLDYLDLYLVHWGVASDPEGGSEPLDDNGILKTLPISISQTWVEMEKLVEEGLTKSIGVANFKAMMLHDLLSGAKIKPAVNQIELHPYLTQTDLIEFCKRNNVQVTAYSPLGTPGTSEGSKVKLLDDPVIIDLSTKYSKTPAQIVLRWAIQRGTIAIPKSTSEERIKENLEVFDFELSDEDMEKINGLDRNHRYVNPINWWGIPYFA